MPMTGMAPHGGAMPGGELHAGRGRAQVRVLRVDEREQGTPIADALVTLQWLMPTGEVATSWEARSGADGWAHFDAIVLFAPRAGLELRASVVEQGARYRSEALRIESGQAVGLLVLRVRSGDASKVVVQRGVTVLRMPQQLAQRPGLYGYLEVQQLLLLSTLDGRAFDTALGTDPRQGLRLALPEGAIAVEGSLRRGDGELKVGDGELRYFGVIPAANEQPADLAIWYAIEADGPRCVFSQALGLAWQDAELAMIRETGLASAPLLDISLEAPGFDEIVVDPDDDPLYARTKVTVARRGRFAADATVRVVVQGLPYTKPQLPPYTAAVVVVILLAGAMLLWRSLRQARARRERSAAEARR